MAIRPTSKLISPIHTTAELQDPITEAVYQLVHNYRDPRTGQRGAAALAPRVGMVPGTLLNKANPEQDHQLTLAESVVLQLAAGHCGILDAYALVLGRVTYELPSADVDDVELLTHYTDYHRRIGAQADRIHNALADGRITAAECTEIARALHGGISAGLTLLARIESLAEA